MAHRKLKKKDRSIKYISWNFAIKGRRLNFYGHMLRMDQNRQYKKCFVKQIKEDHKNGIINDIIMIFFLVLMYTDNGLHQRMVDGGDPWATAFTNQDDCAQ